MPPYIESRLNGMKQMHDNIKSCETMYINDNKGIKQKLRGLRWMNSSLSYTVLI